jgi:hypothetical protein
MPARVNSGAASGVDGHPIEGLRQAADFLGGSIEIDDYRLRPEEVLVALQRRGAACADMKGQETAHAASSL